MALSCRMLDRYSTLSLRDKPFWQRYSSKCRQPRKLSNHQKFKHNLNSITNGPQSSRAARKASQIITTPSTRLLPKLLTPTFNSHSTRALGSPGREALTQIGSRTFIMCYSFRRSGFKASQLITIEGLRSTFNNIFKPFSNNNSSSSSSRSARCLPDIRRPPRSRCPCRKRQMRLLSARIPMNLGSV